MERLSQTDYKIKSPERGTRRIFMRNEWMRKLPGRMLAVFLCAVLVVGVKPLEIKAANRITITKEIEMAAYEGTDMPELSMRLLLCREKEDESPARTLQANDADSGIEVSWDADSKVITYQYEVDTDDYKAYHWQLDLNFGYVPYTMTYPDKMNKHRWWLFPVKFMTEEDTLWKETYAMEGLPIGFKEIPKKSGYQFEGWETADHTVFDAACTDSSTTEYTVNKPMTLYAVWSEVPAPEEPTVSKEAGTYEYELNIQLSAAEGADIYYTLDGTDPTTDSSRYQEPIPITGRAGEDVSTTIKAIAVRDGKSSAIASFSYTIHLPQVHIHRWDTEWTSDSEAHWHACLEPPCTITQHGEEDGYAVHVEDEGTVTTEPTEEQEGVKTYKCRVCGLVMRTETLAKLVPTAAPTEVPTETPTETPTEIPTEMPTEAPTAEPQQTVEPTAAPSETGTPTAVPEETKNPDEVQEVTGDDEESGTAEEDGDTEDDDTEDKDVKGSTRSGGGSGPDTGDPTPVEMYATIAMIAGLSYLLLYFSDGDPGMTERRKKELVLRLIQWAKEGHAVRKYTAMALIVMLLIYYHSIGKRMSAEALRESRAKWKEWLT